MKALVSVMTLVTVMSGMSRWASAQPPVSPSAPSAPSAASGPDSYAPPPYPPPPPAYPPPSPPPPNGAYPAPSPRYGAPYAFGQPPGAPFPRQSVLLYEADKKSPGLGLLLEFFIPGVGSIYADHAQGALVTWGLMIGGVVMTVWGLTQLAPTDSYDSGQTRHADSPAAVPAVLSGIALMVAGRVYGLVDAYSSSTDYNEALAARLGLVSFTVAPLRAVGNRVAWAPALSLRF